MWAIVVTIPFISFICTIAPTKTSTRTCCARSVCIKTHFNLWISRNVAYHAKVKTLTDSLHKKVLPQHGRRNYSHYHQCHHSHYRHLVYHHCLQWVFQLLYLLQLLHQLYQMHQMYPMVKYLHSLPRN